MVSQYSDFTKLKHAKQIAKDGGCFIVEKGNPETYYLLYRIAEPRNQFIGKRTSISAILALTKKATDSK